MDESNIKTASSQTLTSEKKRFRCNNGEFTGANADQSAAPLNGTFTHQKLMRAVITWRLGLVVNRVHALDQVQNLVGVAPLISRACAYNRQEKYPVYSIHTYEKIARLPQQTLYFVCLNSR